MLMPILPTRFHPHETAKRNRRKDIKSVGVAPIFLTKSDCSSDPEVLGNMYKAGWDDNGFVT